MVQKTAIAQQILFIDLYYKYINRKYHCCVKNNLVVPTIQTTIPANVGCVCFGNLIKYKHNTCNRTCHGSLATAKQCLTYIPVLSMWLAVICFSEGVQPIQRDRQLLYDFVVMSRNIHCLTNFVAICHIEYLGLSDPKQIFWCTHYF